MIRVVSIISFLLLCYECNSQWVQQFYGVANGYNSVFFIDENTGWIASGRAVGQNYQGEILKSTNGGSNWFIAYPANFGFNDVYFINHLTGWAVCQRRENFVTTRLILKTTTGGTTFSLQHTDTTTFPHLKIQFLNNNTGYVFTNSSNILKSTNSGASWQSYSIVVSTTIADGMFTSPDTGWIACSFHYVLKSTNGGVNWVSTLDGGEGKIFWKSISFINNQTGWVTDGGMLRSTTNGGSSWNNPGGGNRIIKFVSSLTGYSCGTGSGAFISRTTNGGNPWSTQTQVFFTNFNFTRMFFLNPNTGWAVGYRSVPPDYHSMILKTTNGGITALEPVLSELPQKYFLSQNYPNPFNPKTIINFQLPMFNYVSLKIYDLLGREVQTLVNEQLEPGTYEIDWDASSYPSGVYYYSVSAGDFKETRKMILLK